MYTSSPNKRAFAVTAIVWGGFGALLGRRGSALARFAIGSLVLEQLKGVRLEEALIDLFKKNNSVNQLKPHLGRETPRFPWGR